MTQAYDALRKKLHMQSLTLRRAIGIGLQTMEDQLRQTAMGVIEGDWALPMLNSTVMRQLTEDRAVLAFCEDVLMSMDDLQAMEKTFKDT